MFEELIARVRRSQAEFEFELSRTFDPYRLHNLLMNHEHAICGFKKDAFELLRELEELYDAL